MNLKLNLISAHGRHGGKLNADARDLLTGCVEGGAITVVLLGIYFAACAIH